MENEKLILKVMDYSISPGPRYCNQGDDSGEDFYHKLLNERFVEAHNGRMQLQVDLDGPDGYASSFLDEAFGNLVYDFGLDLVRSTLLIKSEEEPEWIDMLQNDSFGKWEVRRDKSQEPTITIEHEAWYRFIKDEIKKAVWINLSSGK